MATCVALDLRDLSFHVFMSLVTRLRKRMKPLGEMKKHNLECRMPMHIRQRYGKSERIRFVGGNALVPIGCVHHISPMCRNRSINAYTPEGRAQVHKNLEQVDMATLHHLMRNPVQNRSIEYNDNRLSLYCAQQGRCAITGQILEADDIHCHHKLPSHLGGRDNYANLVLVSKRVHRLIHATNPVTIQKYLDVLNLSPKQLGKLQQLKSLVQC